MSFINHVAIIMDGNGRWAKERKKPRVWGHIRGSHIVAHIIEKADELGIKNLTFYALSYENLSRPDTELKVLFKLLEKFLKKERPRILKNRIRFKVIGDYSFVSDKLKNLIMSMEKDTCNGEGLALTFAFGHGGKRSILEAVKYFQKEGTEVDTEKLERYFEKEVPDVDLLIRTGGDVRVSNFLLWQLAYADLRFIKTKWPDFSSIIFEEIISEYLNTEKRFGGITGLKNQKQAQQIVEKKLTKGLL